MVAKGSETYKLDPRNARTHPARNKDAVEKSLRELGAGRSIVVDADGVVIGGNAVYEEAVKLGIPVKEIETSGEELIVVRRVDLKTDDPRRKALALADNQISTLAEWDDDVLDGLLGEIEDIDLDVMGFEDEEEPEDDSEAASEMVDKAAELLEKWEVERGQIWEIPGKAGVHRVMCGDSLNATDVEALCRGQVQGVFTSPPYALQREAKYGGIHPDAYVDWWGSVQETMRKVLLPDGSVFVNIKPHCDSGERSLYVLDLVSAMKRVYGWRFVEELIWTHSGTPGKPVNRFKNQFEPIYQFALGNKFKFRPGNVTHLSDDAISNGGGSNVSASQGIVDVVPSGHIGQAYPGNVVSVGKNREALGHPAAFPVTLPAFFIKAYSDNGDAWYDPFLGSGTTVVAAEQEDRIAYGMEISEKYVAVVLERMASHGLEPVKVYG